MRKCDNLRKPWDSKKPQNKFSKNFKHKFSNTWNTCQNFHHLDEKEFSEVWNSSKKGISPRKFGGVTTFAVKVWSWKLCQIKDPLAFGAAICGSVNQNIVLHSVIKTMPRRTQWSYDYAVRCFDWINSRSRRQRPMDLWSVITSKTKLPQQMWPHLQKI